VAGGPIALQKTMGALHRSYTIQYKVNLKKQSWRCRLLRLRYGRSLTEFHL